MYRRGSLANFPFNAFIEFVSQNQKKISQKKSSEMVGKTSKKGWRNIKLADEMTALATNEHAAELNAKADTLFSEDVTGGMRGVSKAIKKEVKLLTKSNKTSIAVSELPVLERAVARVNKPIKRTPPHNKGKLCDLWAVAPSNNNPHLPGTVVRRESYAPAVVPPSATLSVNPSKAAFESMILAEAEKEVAKQKQSKQTPTQTPAPEVPLVPLVPEPAPKKGPVERKTKAQKLKESLHKQMLKGHENKRKEKANRRAMHDTAARQAKVEEHARRSAAKLQTKVKRIVDEAAGKFTLARGAGGRILKTSEMVPTEIAGSLRRIVPLGDAVLERRESLLKRRMIEQVPEINAEYKEKLRFAKLDNRKAHKLVDKDALARCVLLG